MKPYTGLIIAGIVLCVVVIDIILAVTGGYSSTISWWLWTQSHNWPAIPFSFGVLMGHFFFSQPHIPPVE